MSYVYFRYIKGFLWNVLGTSQVYLRYILVISFTYFIYMAWFSFMWHLAQMEQDIFFSKNPSKSSKNSFFLFFFLHIPMDLWLEASENLIFRFKVLSRVRTVRPKLGVLSSANEVSTGPTCQFLSVCVSGLFFKASN